MATEHPFKGEPQYNLIYTNKHGKPLAHPDNGVGRLPRRMKAYIAMDDLRWDDTGKTVYESDLEAMRRDEEDEPAEDLVSDETLYESLQKLTTRQRFVIELRFGLRDGEVYALEEIASLMGVSNQAVSDHEQAALKRLRKDLESVEVDG